MKTARSRRAPTDALTFVRTIYASRSCETCPWLARNPTAARWLADVLRHMKAGKGKPPLQRIWAELEETFGYPKSFGAFRNHFQSPHREKWDR